MSRTWRTLHGGYNWCLYYAVSRNQAASGARLEANCGHVATAMGGPPPCHEGKLEATSRDSWRITCPHIIIATDCVTAATWQPLNNSSISGWIIKTWWCCLIDREECLIGIVWWPEQCRRPQLEARGRFQGHGYLCRLEAVMMGRVLLLHNCAVALFHNFITDWFPHTNVSIVPVVLLFFLEEFSDLRYCRSKLFFSF